MPITRDELDEIADHTGRVIQSIPVKRDVTVAVVELDAHAKLRAWRDENRAYLAIADPTALQSRTQVAKLTRQTNALIRLLLRDLLADETAD